MDPRIIDIKLYDLLNSVFCHNPKTIKKIIKQLNSVFISAFSDTIIVSTINKLILALISDILRNDIIKLFQGRKFIC